MYSMRLVKRIMVVIVSVLVLIQFIRPKRNSAPGLSPTDISTKLEFPQEVQTILQNSCYDCHSDNTRYPWYAEVQPVGWLLSDDIQDGKKELNFSQFGSYTVRRQYIKLNNIIDQIKEEKMPLPKYLFIHTDARLSQEQRDIIIAWAKAVEDSIKARYPADSLARRH